MIHPRSPRTGSRRTGPPFRGLASALAVWAALAICAAAGAETARLDRAGGLPSATVTAVAQDRYGFVWVATPEGLVRWDGHRVRVFAERPGDGRSLPSRDVRTLFEGRSGHLWVGTAAGLVRFERESGTFRPAESTAEIAAESADGAFRPGPRAAVSLLEDDDGWRWIAAEDGLYFAAPGSPGLQAVPPLDGQPVTALALAQGEIWVGSNHGVARVMAGGGQVRVAPEPLTDSLGRVEALTVDRSGALWIGTAAGLYRLDARQRDLRRVDAVKEVLSLLLSDDGGLLWVGTDRGLEALTVGAELDDEARPRRLDGRRIHHLAAGRSGQVWAATDDGLSGLPRSNAAFHLKASPPSVTFTGLQVDGRPVEPGPDGMIDRELVVSDRLELPAASRMITLELAALRFDRLKTLRYSYRLAGFHTFWQETGADRPQAVYSALPPGNYQLEARAAFEGEPWGEAAFLPVVIRAHPARGFGVAAVVLLAALLGGYGLRHVRLARARRESAVAARLREMQEQKVESLATLAGGVAHDFNNLLVGIFGHAELAKLSVEAGSPARAHLERILTSARRAGELSKQMLFYSGRAQFVVEPLQLSTVVDEAVEALRSTVGERVRLLVEGDLELPSVDGDAGQLRQLVSNLVVNAAEALDGREGFIVVGVRLIDADIGFLSTHDLEGRLAPGAYVSITVDDTAGGIDEVSLGKIFDPFFSTKSPGRGLGLAAAQGIAQGHGGALRASTVPGRGATFRCLLPVGVSDSDTASDELSGGHRLTPTPSPGGRGQALVIEPDRDVRGVARDSLRKLGFDVIEAADHAAAMAVLARQRYRLTLVVLDLQAHGGGLETFHEIRRLEPALPIVLTGVGSEAEARRHIGLEVPVSYLEKPLRLTQLEAVVRENVAGGDIN
ncbi:MAG: two-component regulator propeller domain-containing protein [Acidobacteriota bacterium]